jgi:hypothetical protein
VDSGLSPDRSTTPSRSLTVAGGETRAELARTLTALEDCRADRDRLRRLYLDATRVTRPWRDWRWVVAAVGMVVAAMLIVLSVVVIGNTNRFGSNIDRLEGQHRIQTQCSVWVGTLVRAGITALVTPTTETVADYMTISQHPPPDCVGA